MKPAVRRAMINRGNHRLLSIEEFRVPCAGERDSIVEDAELLTWKIGVKSQEIQSLKPYEAYIGIGKKHHKVMTFPRPDITQDSIDGGAEVDKFSKRYMDKL